MIIDFIAYFCIPVQIIIYLNRDIMEKMLYKNKRFYYIYLNLHLQCRSCKEKALTMHRNK